MTTDFRSPDPEEILANQGFMQRLARGIVGEANLADDVVQQAWLAALEHPPREQGSLRSWLGRVVRNTATNQARSDSRRLDRERRAARPEALPPSDHMELQLELQRRVLEAVQRLEEPYKTAIFLRYYEDLAPGEIAERLSLPEATVKTQLRRGLLSLRTTLDKEFGGDRRAWSLGLVSIAIKGAGSAARASAIPSSTATGARMGAATKAAAAVVLVASSCLWLWNPWRPHGIESATRIAVSAADGSVSDEGTPGVPRHDPGVREAVNSSTRTPVAAATSSAGAKVEAAFHGRVVDSGRFPVSNADVTAFFPGVTHAETKTNQHGEFRIELAERPQERRWRGGVHVVDERGRSVVRSCDIWSRKEGELQSRGGLYSELDPNDRDIGTLVLEDSHRVRARVLDHGAPVAGASVIASWDSRRIPVGEAASDLNGTVTFAAIPTGKVMLRARAPGKEGSVSTFASGIDRGIVDLDLHDTRSIEVSVVDATTGEGVPSAELQVTEDVVIDTSLGVDNFSMAMNAHNAQPLDLPLVQTDSNGKGRIDGVPSTGRLAVSCNADGYLADALRGGARARLLDGATGVQLKLTKDLPHTVHWPLEVGTSGIPPEGSMIRLRRATVASSGDSIAPPEMGRIENGELVVEAFSRGLNEAVAEAPDGSLTRLWVPKDADRGPAIQFKPAHGIDVLVKDDHGRLVEGARAQAFNGGNNLLLLPVLTGTDGRARLQGMNAQLVTVRVVPPGQSGFGDVAGSVDLGKGDGEVEFTLPRMVELCLRLKDHGRPFLPAQYFVCDEDRGYSVSREDPEEGLLFLSVSVSASTSEITLQVRAAGYGSTAKTVAFENGAPPAIVDIDLVAAATIVARVDRPEDRNVELFVDVWDAEKKTWSLGAEMFHYALKSPNGPGGTFRFENCPPGRYRVREQSMKVFSTDVEIAPGSREVDVRIDLRQVRTVSGVVEYPAGIDRFGVRVLVGGIGLDEPKSYVASERYPGVPVDSSGAFTLTIPGNRPTRIQAWHPFLVPAPDSGSIEIVDSRDDVRLRLVAGAEIRIGLPASFLDSKPETLRVLQFAGDADGKPVAWFHAPIVDGIARFSGVPSGKWTLWIDPEKTCEPLTLRNVVVGDGITLLPDPVFARGSSIRVQLIVKSGQSAPRVYLVAASKSTPVYWRGVNSRGEELVTLSGFGRGSFEVEVRSLDEGKGLPLRTVELDGATDFDLTLDLR